MGATKSDFFTDHQNKLSIIFKALGHPARITILEYLLQQNSCICNDLVNVLPLSQSTISQHLKELKNAGLIKGSIEGNSICYCLDENTLDLIKETISTFNNQNRTDNSCC